MHLKNFDWAQLAIIIYFWTYFFLFYWFFLEENTYEYSFHLRVYSIFYCEIFWRDLFELWWWFIRFRQLLTYQLIMAPIGSPWIWINWLFKLVLYSSLMREDRQFEKGHLRSSTPLGHWALRKLYKKQ